MKTILLYILVTATVYNAVPNKTDSTPLITASNKHIDADNPGPQAAEETISLSRCHTGKL